MRKSDTAVLLSHNELESLVETIAILSDDAALRELTASDAELARGEESIAFAAHEFIVGSLLENPQRRRKAPETQLDDRRSARRGTYRVIYRVDDALRRVTVVVVVHRFDPYW